MKEHRRRSLLMPPLVIAALLMTFLCTTPFVAALAGGGGGGGGDEEDEGAAAFSLGGAAAPVSAVATATATASSSGDSGSSGSARRAGSHRRHEQQQQGGAAPQDGANVTAPPPSRTTRSPRWEYCAGSAVSSDPALYSPPGCQAASVQQPRVNRTHIEFAPFELRNLSFCCKANYTAILPVGTDVRAKDREAEYLYNEARLGLISRIPCEYFFPYHTCEPCLYAYRTWVCAVTFPALCRSAGGDEAVKVCRDVCIEVRKRCPTEFGFACPEDDTMFFGHRDAQMLRFAMDTEQRGRDVGVTAAGCNIMHYDQFRGIDAGGGARLSGSSVVALLLLVLLAAATFFA